MRPAHRRAQIVRDHALGDPAEKPQRARGCSSTPRAPRRTPAPRAAPRSPGPRWAPCARRRRRTASRRRGRARRARRRVAMQIDRSVVSEDPVHRHQPDCHEAEERRHVVSVAESGPVDDRPCRGPVVLDGVDPVRVYVFRPAPAVLERGAGRHALRCGVEVAPLVERGIRGDEVDRTRVHGSHQVEVVPVEQGAVAPVVDRHECRHVRVPGWIVHRGYPIRSARLPLPFQPLEMRTIVRISVSILRPLLLAFSSDPLAVLFPPFPAFRLVPRDGFARAPVLPVQCAQHVID